MPTPRRPWTQRIFDLLATEQSLDRETIIRLASPWVPQGHAYRAREIARSEANRLKPRKTTRRFVSRPLDAYETHRIGARIVIAGSLIRMVRDGKIVRDGDHYRLPDRSAGIAPSARESA